MNNFVARGDDNLFLASAEEKAAFILEQISRATNFLHTQGGMHRDLKPENFMFENDTPGAALKLVDFGSTTGSRCAHLEEYLFHSWWIGRLMIELRFGFYDGIEL